MTKIHPPSPLDLYIVYSILTSDADHAKRLSDLEIRLTELSEQSATDSELAKKALNELSIQLASLDPALQRSETSLTKFTSQVQTLQRLSTLLTDTWHKMQEREKTMQAAYDKIIT